MSNPKLPIVDLQILEDLSPEGSGFLRLKRHRLRIRREDGSESRAFVYDSVHRPALDAVVVVAHFAREGRRMVYLRSAIRPPAALRPLNCRPLPEAATLGSLWELPAGLVEPDECRLGALGLTRSAARELEEEIGIALEPEAMRPLGPATFPSAGVIGERHHFFEAEVDPGTRRTPGEDGSALEEAAAIVEVELEQALDMLRSGAIEDGKTEIALRRFVERHGL
jgi:ADP-ribose pyrophosphatase